MARDPRKYCLNCEHPFLEEQKGRKQIYCVNCGQSSRAFQLSLWDIVKDAFSSIFNLDSRIVHTLKDLVFPARITKTYISGKRKYYVNPARLFIFSLILLVTVILTVASFNDADMGASSYYTNAVLSKRIENFNSVADSLGKKENKKLIDTLRYIAFRRTKDRQHDTLGLNGPTIGFLNKQVKDFGISRYDAVNLDTEEIYKKYNIDDWKDQFQVKQYIKMASNPSSAVKYIIKNIVWSLLITVIVQSFMMYLFYIRGSYYLVEHVVLLFNIHSLILFAVSLWVLINTFLFQHDYSQELYNAIFIFSLVIILFRAFKKYYQQSGFMTFVKFLMFVFSYITIGFVVLTFVTIISVFLY